MVILVVVSIFMTTSNSKDSIKRVSVVIPAYNEQKSIAHVISVVKEVKEITQIIVVNDGSTDNTEKIVSNIDGVTLINHKVNKGKGSAMKTGLKEVTGQIVLFLDADLSEITKEQVKAILKPILDNEADITKTKFKREAGRVTELTAKPLLQFFFPELSFEQPLSGQFAAIKSFLDKIDLEKDYGVDIGIVLDAEALGMRIQEVDIGDIVHEMSTLKELNLMANEVVRTIVDRAISYGRLTMMD
jgi:glycosyltransferase involved in cell wall biosynthesis